MAWSSLFDAQVVVLGCGNILFGDDGLGPRCIQALEAQGHLPPDTALVDAGTSLRTLLTDMVLMQARPRRVIVLDAVQQEGRTAGSIQREDLDAHHEGDPAGGFLHHAPTWGLLRQLRDALGADVVVLTVQAACIPELMDDSLSPEVTQVLPLLMDTVRRLCGPDEQGALAEPCPAAVPPPCPV